MLPSREDIKKNRDGQRLPEGWNTLKVTDVKSWQSKTDSSALPALMIVVANPEDIEGTIWLRLRKSPSGMIEAANARTWDDILNLFNIDYDPEWDFDKFTEHMNQQLVGEVFDALIKWSVDKEDKSKIYVNYNDFAPSGEGEDKEKAPPAKPVAAEKPAAPKPKTKFR